MTRLNREDYFRGIVETVRLRGTCDRGKAGAIIVKDNRILCTGYAGSPSGIPHCDDIGHELQRRILSVEEASKLLIDSDKPEVDPLYKVHCIRTVHAEMNAILQAAKYGIAINGADIWCTMFPCYDCAKAIINAGIRMVHAEFNYQSSERSRQIFINAGIDWMVFHNEIMEY